MYKIKTNHKSLPNHRLNPTVNRSGLKVHSLPGGLAGTLGMEKNMASFEQLDLLLGEALENMMGAAAEIRALNTEHTEEDIKHIGMATIELWAIRDRIYSVRPDIKRDFVVEIERDPQRYEELSDLHQRAGIAEESGNINLALTLYTELLRRSQYGWFKLLGEAGLYRTSKEKIAQPAGRGERE